MNNPAVKRVFVVTRHAGALHWIRKTMGMEVLAIDHLENLYFRSGDVVCGIFPLHLAARICATGAEVHAITVEVPVELRGVKMDIDTMLQLGAKLVQFDVRRVTKLGWDDIRCEAPRFFPT